MPLESARAVQWLIAERLGISIDSMMMVDVGAGEGLISRRSLWKRPHQLDQRRNRFSHSCAGPRTNSKQVSMREIWLSNSFWIADASGFSDR